MNIVLKEDSELREVSRYGTNSRKKDATGAVDQIELKILIMKRHLRCQLSY
jgi:hypothetical protein